MQSYTKMLNVVKYVGLSILSVGLIALFYSIYVSGSASLTGISIGLIVGAVFIFLMGLFFVATEEMLENS